jgi:2-oxo-4-hydroxy-4-carboxy-5-ureidoimidazoline decarboxylase
MSTLGPASTPAELRDALAACLAVPRWLDEVTAGAPYESLERLLVAARAAATPLGRDEVDAALAHHPRIGERPAGDAAAQVFSRVEQASPDADDAALAARIAAGNREYEALFGRVFLIRAAGRTRAEILAELTRRLALDDATELDVVAEQLRQIALLRIEQLWRS